MTSEPRSPRSSAAPPPSTSAGAAANASAGTIELSAFFALSGDAWLVFDQSGRVHQASDALARWSGGSARLAEWPEALRTLLGWPRELPATGQTQCRSGWLAPASGGAPAPLRVQVRGLGTRWLAQLQDRSNAYAQRVARSELATLRETLGVNVATHDAQLGWVSPVPTAEAQTDGDGDDRANAAAQPQADDPSAASSTAPSTATRRAYSRAINRDVIDPASLPAYERLQRALRQREAADVDYSVRDPDLGLRQLRTHVRVAALGSGRSAATVVTLDVTDDNELAAAPTPAPAPTPALAGTHGELAALLASGAAQALLQGERVARASAAFAQALGLPHPLPADMPLPKLLARAGVPSALTDDAWLALRTQGQGSAEFTLAPPGQPSRWVRLTLQRSAVGTAGRGGAPVVAQLSDTTEARRLAAELGALARERELVFGLSDVGILTTQGGRITRVNPALADLLGRSAEGLLGLPVAELFDDERAHLAWRSRERLALQAGGEARGECQLRRGDGGLVWVQMSVRLLDGVDEAAGTIASVVSVDDRRRARESLEVQGERTRAILDSVLVGIVTVGAGGIEWMNRSARRMFGGELVDFVGQPMAVVASPEPDHPLRRTDWMSVLREGQAQTFECRLQARDGRTFWVVGNAVATGRDSGAGQITFALLDIQRRREAEQQTAQARANLQRIIETAPLAIALLDARTHQVLQLNDALTRLARRPAEEIQGRAPALWLPGLEAAALTADLHRALAQGPDGDEVVREWKRAGDASADEPLRVWDTRLVALGESGEMGAGMGAQVLLVASDVTTQRAADEARLHAAIAQRDMLVREVHHRIKNNLQGVAGLLQQSVQRHPEAAAAIAEAVSQVHAIAQVHGLQVGATGPLRVRAVVDAIAQSVQRMFGRRVEVAVSGEPAHRFALTEADAIPVALTVNELLTNAIKHAGDSATPIACALVIEANALTLTISNPGRLPEGFALDAIPGGISGLGLVRALLPRKGAAISLAADGPLVHARLRLEPPAVALLEPL